MWTLQKDSDQFYSDLLWILWKLPRIQSSTGLRFIGIIWCEQKEDWGSIWAKLDLKKSQVLFRMNSQCEQKKNSTPFLLVHFMVDIKRTEFGSFITTLTDLYLLSPDLWISSHVDDDSILISNKVNVYFLKYETISFSYCQCT